MAGIKFSGLSSRLLLLSVEALIMLSAAVVTEETRKCYWCGPLAEQVHRSQRAPSCETPDDQVTTCEPGLSYCAVVATSPPYVESRYCVKNYREECYPLYCNSTKTWKMTCPCKNDLCNGVNTEREREAFAALSKLVGKTQNKRITKRNGQPNVKFTQSSSDETQIIINPSGSNLPNGTLEDDVAKSEQLTEIVVSNGQAIDKEINSLENLIESTEDTITADDSVSGDATNDNIKTIETTKNDIPNAMTTPEPQLVTNVQKPLTILQMENAKSKEELPTAEALQQNASPITPNGKTLAPTTVNDESTTTLTTIDVGTATEETKTHKNADILLIPNIFTVIATNVFAKMLVI